MSLWPEFYRITNKKGEERTVGFFMDWRSVSDYTTFMSKILTGICFSSGKCDLDGFICLTGVKLI